MNRLQTLSLPNIYLVGPMGAGKTTIGRYLAEFLQRDFVDSDHEIEARTGANIPWIFEKEGEEGFRTREKMVIEDLTRRKSIILATGGGAVTQAENREHLHARGLVVYLYTPVEIQLARTARDRNRPLLKVDNPQLKLQQLLEQRDPLYRQAAHIIVPSQQGSPKDMAKLVMEAIKCYVEQHNLNHVN
ncbi:MULTISPECIES: shikimate kinase AroK [unclassified Acinetobacter]|uniref:shikimate kinase AroK n=1 Tax=unclassified Acinetobacter TaxID=196816 RepID=UPI0035BB5F75